MLSLSVSPDPLLTFNPSQLQNFFIEFFHPDRHANDTKHDRDVVILSPEEPSEELKVLMLKPILEDK